LPQNIIAPTKPVESHQTPVNTIEVYICEFKPTVNLELHNLSIKARKKEKQ